jgi:transposase
MMGAVFQADIALGSVPALEQKVSTALEEPVREAQEYIKEQAVVNADETGWRQSTQRHWLWLGTTPQVTVFLLTVTRGAKAARQLLGETFEGILGSDRWGAYNWIDRERRQVCWAHLRRDFQALVDRGGESARVGQALLEQVGSV